MENECRNKRRHKRMLGPLVLIIVGVVLLLEKNGIIGHHIFHQWWPLLLIGAGGWMLVTRCDRNEPKA
jgi:hypothetical protein